MARAWFGRGAEDFIVSGPIAPGDPYRPAATVLTFWDAETGGTQYTDLLLNGTTPVTSITVPATGQTPAFQGPDGVVAMWAQAGNSAARRVVDAGADIAMQAAVDRAAAEAAAAAAIAVGETTDAQVGSSLANRDLPTTGDELAASYEAKVDRTGATTGQVPILQAGGTLAFGTVSGGGGGDVTGPASSTTGRVATFGDTTGKALADGGATVAQIRDRATHTGTQALSTITGTGDAAAKNTGTAAGTVAAGDDSRITGAAQKSANLSDLANASTARANLDAASSSGGGREKSAALSATTGTATGDLSAASVFTVTPTGNITLAFSNVPASGTACTVTVIVSQGATVRTVTPPTGTKWMGAPAPTQVANKACIINLLTVNGGTTWYATAAVEQ